MARRKNPPPANETKADKFRRVARERIDKIVKSLRSLEGLTGRTYEYTPEQIEKIEAYLKNQLDATINKFKGKADHADLDI